MTHDHPQTARLVDLWERETSPLLRQALRTLLDCHSDRLQGEFLALPCFLAAVDKHALWLERQAIEQAAGIFRRQTGYG